MLKNEKIIYFLIFLIMSEFHFSQTNKDYKSLYFDYIKSLKTEQEYNSKIMHFFNSMSDYELPIALVKIAENEEPNFIAYNLFILNHERFSKKDFRENMLNLLSSKAVSSNFKIVLIDFIFDFVEKDELHRNKLNGILFNLAKDSNLPNGLRSYAASHSCIGKDYEKDKKSIIGLLFQRNYSVMNGAAKAVRKFLKSSSISLNERLYWADILINTIQNNLDSLKEIKALIMTLGLTKTSKAQEFLLNLFINYVKHDSEITEALAYSLSNFTNTAVINTLFTNYSEYEQYDNFGTELILKQIVDDNKDLIDKLYEENNFNFLKAVRLMKVEDRNKYLNKVKISLDSNNEIERIESVKTLHFLLSYEEEKEIFSQHLKKEENENVKNQIYFYIGQ